MDISSVLDEDQIIINLDKKQQVDVINELATVLAEKGIVTDQTTFVQSVLEREQHSTTGIGNGIAIPHGKSESVLTPAIVIGKLLHAVEWESLDEKPVEVVIMLAIPEAQKGDTHLKLLSEIAIKLMDDEFVEQLKAENNTKKIVDLFN